MSLKLIQPFVFQEQWVFNAPEFDLVHEAFVRGAGEIIDQLVEEKAIDDAHEGFALYFSDSKFVGADIALERRHSEDGGWWYHSQDYGRMGWLCPALFNYFDNAPATLYVRAEPLPRDPEVEVV